MKSYRLMYVSQFKQTNMNKQLREHLNGISNAWSGVTKCVHQLVQEHWNQIFIRNEKKIATLIVTLYKKTFDFEKEIIKGLTINNPMKIAITEIENITETIKETKEEMVTSNKITLNKEPESNTNPKRRSLPPRKCKYMGKY
jgi:hypothetical protein